jgi:hypothetical protein
VRTQGTAVFLNRGKETTPLAMRANCEHNHVLHEHVIIMVIDTLPVPRVPESERTEIDDLGYGDDGIIHLTAHFGWSRRRLRGCWVWSVECGGGLCWRAAGLDTAEVDGCGHWIGGGRCWGVL